MPLQDSCRAGGAPTGSPPVAAQPSPALEPGPGRSPLPFSPAAQPSPALEPGPGRNPACCSMTPPRTAVREPEQPFLVARFRSNASSWILRNDANTRNTVNALAQKQSSRSRVVSMEATGGPRGAPERPMEAQWARTAVLGGPLQGSHSAPRMLWRSPGDACFL